MKEQKMLLEKLQRLAPACFKHIRLRRSLIVTCAMLNSRF
jgi:hypothetical protein